MPANDLGTSLFYKHSSITDFSLQLPMKDQGEIKSIILPDYFQGILDGKVSIQDLLGKSTLQALRNIKKGQKMITLKKRWKTRSYKTNGKPQETKSSN